MKLIKKGAVLNQELIDYYCCQSLGPKVFKYLSKHADLSNENINNIYLNSNLEHIKKQVKDKITINNQNIAEFFRKIKLTRFSKKLGNLKPDIKCLENACLLSGNAFTIKKLFKKYYIKPNAKCLENACSIYDNYESVRYLTGFNLEITRQCLINLLKIADHSKTTRCIIEILDPEKIEMEAEGIENI